MELFLSGLALEYPIIFTIISIIGMVRLVVKPLMVILHSLAEATETTRDEEILRKLEENKVWKGFLFILDYVFSLKLKKPIILVEKKK